MGKGLKNENASDRVKERRKIRKYEKKKRLGEQRKKRSEEVIEELIGIRKKGTLIKKKTKFSSSIRIFRWDRLQSHI